MSVFKTIKFTASTIDGVIQAFPQTLNLRCEWVTPVGKQVVRNYNGSECIRVIDVFLIYYCGQSLGTLDFNNADDFINYLNTTCNPCKQTSFTINGCYALVNGCILTE